MDKTITATYTTTEEKLLFFATAKGWTPTVKNPEYNPNVEDSQEIIENSETVEQFVARFGTKMLTAQLSDPAIKQILKESREEQKIKIDTINQDVESGLVVEVV